MLQTLKGYEEVNRITERERKDRLEKMTEEEARAIFDSLCETAQLLSRDDEEQLMKYRLAHLIKVRKTMEMMSHHLGFKPK